MSTCIQSCSKVVKYLVAQARAEGFDVKALGCRLDSTALTWPICEDYIGAEPSGLAFNARALDAANRPHNPYINSGAIMACSLVAADQPIDKLTSSWTPRRASPGVAPGFNNSVFLSERGADRNCLAYMMKECGSSPGGTEFSDRPREDPRVLLHVLQHRVDLPPDERRRGDSGQWGALPVNERIFKA